MDVQSAISFVQQIIYKPGWRFDVIDHTSRFEGTIDVHITYPALDSGSNSNPDTWKDGYTTGIPGGARAAYPIIVSDTDEIGVLRRLLNAILDIEEHEAREFLRYPHNGWAPFHPHRIDGMTRWGTVDHDLKFGLS